MKPFIMTLTLGLALSLTVPALARQKGRVPCYPGYFNAYDTTTGFRTWYPAYNTGYTTCAVNDNRRGQRFTRPFGWFPYLWGRHDHHNTDVRFDRNRHHKRHNRHWKRDRSLGRYLPQWGYQGDHRYDRRWDGRR
jgi:hypothetical protein